MKTSQIKYIHHISRYKLFWTLSVLLFLSACHLATKKDMDAAPFSLAVSADDLTLTFKEKVQKISVDDMPISFQPQLACQWVWLSDQILRCMINRNNDHGIGIQGNTRYSINLSDGLTSVNALPVYKYSENFVFSRPEARYLNVVKWSSQIDPIFSVQFNTEINRQALKPESFNLVHEGKKYPLEVLDFDKNNYLLQNHLARMEDQVVLLQPKVSLAYDTHYQLAIDDNIKPLKGDVKSKEEVTSLSLKTYGLKNKLMANYCSDKYYSWHSKKVGTCFLDDYFVFQLDREINYTLNPHCQRLLKRGLLKDKGYNKKYHIRVLDFFDNQTEFKSCLEKVTDVFDQVSDLTEVLTVPFEDSFRPKLHLKNKAYQYGSLSNEITLVTSTMNLDAFHVQINKVNDQEVDLSFTQQVTDNQKNKYMTTQIEVPFEGEIHAIAGEIGIKKDSKDTVPFNVTKAPFHISLKTNPRFVALMLHDAKNMQPAKKTAVKVITQMQSYQGITDDSGFVQIEVLPSDFDDENEVDELALLINYQGKEYSINDIDELGYETSSEESDDDYYTYDEGELLVWGITDKPLYRAGEKVKYKLYFREKKGDGFVIPKIDSSIFANVQGYNRISGYEIDCSNYLECHSFFKKEIMELDQFGSVSGEFKIPLSTKNADFSFNFAYPTNPESEETTYWGDEKSIYSEVRFQVTDFQTSPYLLSVATDKKMLTPNSPFTITGEATYYSGGPVINQNGELTVEVSAKNFVEDHPQYSGYSFLQCHGCYGETDFISSLTYDDQGQISTEYKIKANDVKYGTVKFNAGIEPENSSWTYSQNLNVPYYQDDYFVGIKADQYMYLANEKINIESILVKYTGEEQSNPSFKYEVAKVNENGGVQAYEAIACSENNKCQTTISQAGRYKLKAKSAVAGVNYEHEIDVYVYQPSHAFNYTKYKSPQILLDKPKYDIGDVAKITINMPYPKAKVAVYLERNRILKHWVKSTDNGSIVLEFPITEQAAPGFSVSTDLLSINGHAVDNRKLRYSDTTVHTQVNSDRVDDTFEIITDKAAYLPGSDIKLTVKSSFDTDAEFTVALIDSAVVSLIDEKYYYDMNESSLHQATKVWQTLTKHTLKPVNLMMDTSGLGISEISFDEQDEQLEEQGKITVTGSRISREDLGSHPPATKGGVIDKKNSVEYTGTDSNNMVIAGVEIPLDQLRLLFKESAYFETGLRVQPGQEVSQTIRLPDNIGSWKVILVGADLKGKIDVKSQSIKAKKDLEVYANLPEQLTIDDRFIGQVNVVDKSNEASTLQIAAQAESNNGKKPVTAKKIQENAIQNQQYSMALPITVDGVNDIQVTAIVRSESSQDGLIKHIPVRGKSISGSEQLIGQFSAASELINFDISHRTAYPLGSLTLKVNPSISNQLNPTFNYMEKYPHQCWEQQLAKATAAAVKLNLNARNKNLGLTEEANEMIMAQEKGIIQDVINRAIDFQASNGGMTFFGANKENVSPFLTFHTHSMFKALKVMGYDIPTKVTDHIKEFATLYVSDYQRFLDNKRYEYDTEQNQYSAELFFMAYFINESKKVSEPNEDSAAIFELLTSDTNALSVNSLNQLVINDTENKTTYLNALSQKYFTNGNWLALLKEPKSDWFNLESGLKSQCETVSALLDSNQNEEDKDPAFRHLLNILGRSDSSGILGSTLENSVCLLAFNTFIERFESLENETIRQVVINGIQQQLTSEPIMVDVTQPLNINIANPKETQLYYSASLDFQQDANHEITAGEGLEITRTYAKFDQGKWHDVRADQFQTGDWIKTEVTIINPIQRSFIAVSSPNPGAWVPVNPMLSTSVPVGLIDQMDKESDSSYFYERQLQPATSKFYADFLPSGVHKITYYSKVLVGGEFSALPAVIEAMYNKKIRAQTKLEKVAVKTQ
ncbi:alpha-2-macroglobulin family protein [Marinicella rhabdoformis]|uniref:alpha-2-macroglobulin family protein n=1 Tax=Marinicella rhabdoformis TaxID=2580566 RepID=UPI0012AED259|nr:alpha-2-macroglobulin family protein [Marinicella rhabdoformis]